ncbi:MAG: Holliday junction resolvase RuvX [Crocinitomicaceae bacterium]|nr:Holliday junction resolvase RuvX [Flavobacteriales bacterium]NQZ34231.1 Holliday junction resolvase RuvX [Crocinitomicaceae bacterium]
MGKAVSIDFGLKRTGIALSDDSRIFAFGLDTVESKNLMTFLIDLEKKERFTTIVLGMPKRLNNEDSHVSENVRLLKVALEKQFVGLEVILLDERFTSKMASASMHVAGATKKQKQQKGLVDKVSATIILQSYLGQ